MADMLTVTVGTTDYTFDWIAQHIRIEAGVIEVTAADLKTAIGDAQDDPVAIPFPPISTNFNPVTLTGTSSTFLNVVLNDQWRIDSFSGSGTLTVGEGNVVNENNGIDIFVPNVLVSFVNNTSAAGVLVGGGTAATAQAVWDYIFTSTNTAEEESIASTVAAIQARDAADAAELAADAGLVASLNAETEAIAAAIASASADAAAQAAEAEAILAKNAVLALDPIPNAVQMTQVWEAHFRRREWNKVSEIITIYDSDNLTPLFVFDTNADLSDIIPQ